MSKDQQIATRQLQAAEDAYLIAYGWQRVGQGWSHPRIQWTNAFRTFDAIQLTKAKPELGWP